MTNYKKGEVVKGIVSGIEPYGIFVKLDDNTSGLIHISEISTKFVRDTNEYVKIDETIFVKILDFDKNNHITLSIKDIPYKLKNSSPRRKIIETKLGFKTLAYKLPIWIEENLRNKQK